MKTIPTRFLLSVFALVVALVSIGTLVSCNRPAEETRVQKENPKRNDQSPEEAHMEKKEPQDGEQPVAETRVEKVVPKFDDQPWHMLLSSDIKVREAELVRLNRKRRELGDQFDLPEKFKLFQELLKMESLNYISRATYFLGKLPVDEEVLDFAEKNIRNNTTDFPSLISSLTYLRNKAPGVFEQYFKSREYHEHDQRILQIFVTSQVVQELDRAHREDIVARYLNWQWRPSDPADSPNPVRAEILEVGPNIVPELLAAYERNTTNEKVVNRIVWVLGELGSPLAFHKLLEMYKSNPSRRVGIAIGSCLGSLYLDDLIETFQNDELRTLLGYIYGSRWERVKDKTFEEIKVDILENFVEIKEDCMQRSRPSLG